MKIGILHYSYPPTIGGVEFIIEQHASLFTRHGHQVRVISSQGIAKKEEATIIEIPELSASHPLTQQSQQELLENKDPQYFEKLKETLKTQLLAQLEDLELLFVHNLFSMHFNIAATAALFEIAEESNCRMVSWVHDLSAINPDYQLPDSYPWSLLSQSPPSVESIAISELRTQQFHELTRANKSEAPIPVISNGVEILRLLELSDEVWAFNQEHGLLYRDAVLIHPTRILPRKNIEKGIEITAALKNLGLSCLYLVTGALDPHNSELLNYATELKDLIRSLELENEVLFVSEHFTVADDDLKGLYALSDALLQPSKQEGFGLPLIEAGFFRLPIFCSAIEPMRSLLKNNVSLFELDEDPHKIAQRIMNRLWDDPSYRVRKETIRKYSWDRLYQEEIAPRFFSTKPSN